MASQKRKAGSDGKSASVEKVPEVVTETIPDAYKGMIGISNKFAVINKLITRDLNGTVNKPTFALYTKDQIATYISNPYTYETQLRRAVNYIYGASTHFRRLIQYFTSLSDLSYIVSPYRIDPATANVKSVSRNYRKTLNLLSSMSIRTQFPKILTVCLREDVCYITSWVTNDSIIFQQLPSDYCKIASIENNVFNVYFNFAYFDARPYMLDFFPAEFKLKYEQLYKKDTRSRWIELSAPYSFAIKCNNDTPDYAMPPFAGILREVYELEDYKALKLTKTALENYAMVAMRLPMDEDGNWQLDYNKAVDFWQNLDAVLPEEVGSILTPMALEKINFEKSNTGDTDTVSDAEQNLYSAAGVSSLLFNNARASANALLLSIKADQALTFGIVKSLEDAVNRIIQYQNYGKNFKVTFLNVSEFNRKEVGDSYLKAASYGLPTISLYAASQGLGQAELDTMSFLEGRVLGLVDMFRPLVSSSQQSAEVVAERQAGRPTKEIGDLTDSGEQTREDSSDWG